MKKVSKTTSGCFRKNLCSSFVFGASFLFAEISCRDFKGKSILKKLLLSGKGDFGRYPLVQKNS